MGQEVTFHKRAWYAAADEYGRQRAAQYGRYANTRRALGLLAVIILLLLVIVAAQGGFGG